MTFATGALLHLNQKDFDFNVQFEHLFFSIIPSALFILTSLWRTISRARKPAVVNAPTFQIMKSGTITIYIGLELALLVLTATGSFHATSMFIASSTLNLVSALFMLTLSVVDHSRSPRPSILLSTYLFLTLLLDAAQARTLFLSSDDKPELTYSSIFCASIALKTGILLLEARQKTKWITWDKQKHSPEETSGIFSLGVFFWLNKMFFVGYKNILTIEDLYPLDSSFNAQVLHEDFKKYIDYSKLKGDRFGLLKVLIRTLKVPLLLPIAPRLALVGFTFCQPLFIERLLVYLSQSEPDPNTGYGLIGASMLIYFGMAISYALSWYFHHRLRTMARSILVTEIFSAAVNSRIGSSDDSATLTLMSTDIERIKMGLRFIHETWASIIQAGLASWMLYEQLGVVFVAPIGVVIVCSIGLGILVNFTGDSQRTWMSGIQKRVGLTATVIASMKSLKISGLSATVGDYVQQLRVDELAAGARFRKIFIIAAVFAFMSQLISPPLTFAFTQRTIDASTIFTSLSFLTLLTNPLSQLFQSIPELVSGLACLGRIQAYLESEPREDFRQWRSSEDTIKDNAAISEPSSKSSSLIIIRDACFGWTAEKYVLQNINTQISKSFLTMVVGPVGSGKSTFCKALLGEMPFSEGSVVTKTQFRHIGFCEQTAFLSNGTIRENIIGFSPFNSERYNEVIEATALAFDFGTLPRQDHTNIGSDGIALSGGQKQRVSLARALYLQSELLVLDDVFSGLDADTEAHVFQQVFGADGMLRRRRSTVVLCTHSIRHLPSADYIIALEDGIIREQGTFDHLSNSQGYIQRLGLKSIPDREPSCEKPAPKKGISNQPQLDRATTGSSGTAPLSQDAIALRQVGDATVYKHYFKSMGWFVAACSLFFAALWGFFTNYPSIWLTYWGNAVASDNPPHSYAYYAGIYALLQMCAMVALLLLGITLFIVSVKKAGAVLHQDALRTLIRAPLSFFTKTDTGVVTNLFSQDLNLIDTELPDATLNTLFCVSQSIGQAAVMLTSSVYLAISYPLLGSLLTHFLDTLKGIATLRALGFLTEEVEKNARLVDSSQRAAYLLLMIQEWLNLVLNLVVMVIAVVLTTLAVRLRSSSGFAGASLYSLMSFGENLSGVVFFYTRLETSIGAIARLKNFNETVTPEDREEEDVSPDEEWPEHGTVELKGVSARYGTLEEAKDETPLALNNINLSIHSGEKVAICGRTGSGKSSLLALLLKILDPLPNITGDAAILMDNIPLNRINRSTLRQRLIAVPQDAVFLPDGSTFQENLDPSHISTAAECQSILEAVGLWSFVQEHGGLNAPMVSGTFSAGQRQLLSLGRAMLRRGVRARFNNGGGILLLDEVSSRVDHETERVMQEIVRVSFKDYTVISVSHRLDMVMDFDRVVVMDMGEVVEVGVPAVLKGITGSRFADLVRAGGK
ncbi:ABC multidrug transporter [Penicillium pulvis]|uniref:ABC multidrug transporter n=1 Tax=Penicillium pulvis TaxID=1562058 RepID=UPI002547FA0D|nr:ABC multidrug transporter [Penicillium pulvis]KAJ5803205.1 ABC multidrug transporter [Penicillium pulvis]